MTSTNFSLLLQSLLMIHLVISSHGYPSGAPADVCSTLQPSTVDHGASAQNSDSPYSLTVSSDSVEAGQTVTVKVTGTDGLNLRGIFLQARASDDTTALGSFTTIDEDNYQTRDCSSTTGSGVTHKNRDDKAVPQTFTWTAPDGLNGEVEFVATIVQTTNTYWMNVKSEEVSVADGAGNGADNTTPAQLGFLLAVGLFQLIG